MKTSKKVLISAAFAAITGLLGLAREASAVSCGTSNIAWTTQGKCNAPNQNRGSLQGAGTLNTNGRNLLLIVTSGFGNTSGQGEGLNSGFTRASGPNGSCLFTTTPGVNKFSASGTCNNGTVHRLTIFF
ncbi:MAG TPA: hypothetical protein VMG12_06190 [Polyangiaceae bacterium]|nr:hypothetical protein [Polyangiaceae bacterium]